MINYQVWIDFNRNGNFDHALSDITNRVRDGVQWTSGWQQVDQVESNVAAHVSPVNRLTLVLDNEDGMLSYESTTADFYNLIQSGLMVKVVIEYGGVSHSFTYFTESINDVPGRYGAKTVSLSCVCAMPRVQQARFNMDVQTNITSDEAVDYAMGLATVILPYTTSYFFIDISEIDSDTPIFDADTDVAEFNDIESGYSTLPYVGDVIEIDRKGNHEQRLQNFVAEVCIGEAFGRFFYQPRDVKFHFHNRYHDKLQTTQFSLDENDYVDATVVSTKIYNDVEVHYFPRSVDTTDTNIFISKETPIEIRPGQEKTVRVRYEDPDSPESPAVALSFINPVPETDIIVLDGDDNEVTGQSYLSNDLTSSGGSFYFKNDSSDTYYIDTLIVRGKLVTLYDEQVATARDGASIGLYNWVQMPSIRALYIDDADFAQGMVDFLLSRHKTMHRVFKDVSFVLTEENFEFLSATIGDVVQIAEGWSGHDSEYVILGEQHQLDIAQDRHTVKWILRANDTTPYFIIDTDYVDSEAIIGL